MLETIVLLQGEATTTGGNSTMQMIMLLSIIPVFYFLILRPQQKRAKDEKKFRETLGKGDKVKTIGGIYGQIEKIDDESVVLKIDNEVKIRVEKSAVRSTGTPDEKK